MKAIDGLWQRHLTYWRLFVGLTMATLIPTAFGVALLLQHKRLELLPWGLILLVIAGLLWGAACYKLAQAHGALDELRKHKFYHFGMASYVEQDGDLVSIDGAKYLSSVNRTSISYCNKYDLYFGSLLRVTLQLEGGLNDAFRFFGPCHAEDVLEERIEGQIKPLLQLLGYACNPLLSPQVERILLAEIKLRLDELDDEIGPYRVAAAGITSPSGEVLSEELSAIWQEAIEAVAQHQKCAYRTPTCQGTIACLQDPIGPWQACPHFSDFEKCESFTSAG